MNLQLIPSEFPIYEGKKLAISVIFETLELFKFFVNNALLENLKDFAAEQSILTKGLCNSYRRKQEFLPE
jgi:hypothetical protein